MMPVGLTSFQQSKGINTSSQIAGQIFAEVQATTFASLTGGAAGATTWRLPAPNSGGTILTRYFDDQGTEMPPGNNGQAPAGALYQVNTRVLIATPAVLSPTAATTTTNTDLATVTVQVAYDPSGVVPDFSAVANATNLWTTTAANGKIPLQVYNYELYVAKNL